MKRPRGALLGLAGFAFLIAGYPACGVPFAQRAYLKALDIGTGDSFGISTAISGNTLVVGAPNEDSNAVGINGNPDNNNSPDSGAVYVYVRDGNQWVQQAYLKASNVGAGDFFGQSVAVSGDTVVVGAWGESSGATGVNGDGNNNRAPRSGAAYVFKRDGTDWRQVAYLKASNTGTNDLFKEAVSISSDTLIVAAPGESSNAMGVNGDQGNNRASAAGAAYVFSSQALRPDLVIAQSERHVTLAWPVMANGFALEWSASVGAPASWHPEPTAPEVIGDENVVTLGEPNADALGHAVMLDPFSPDPAHPDLFIGEWVDAWGPTRDNEGAQYARAVAADGAGNVYVLASWAGVSAARGIASDALGRLYATGSADGLWIVERLAVP